MNSFDLINDEAARRGLIASDYRFSTNLRGQPLGSSGAATVDAPSQGDALERLRLRMPYHDVAPLYGPSTGGAGWDMGI